MLCGLDPHVGVEGSNRVVPVTVLAVVYPRNTRHARGSEVWDVWYNCPSNSLTESSHASGETHTVLLGFGSQGTVLYCEEVLGRRTDTS